MDHEIVQDLLALYHDGVCSDKSRAAVEAHLKTCEACQKALAEMDAPLPGAERAAAAKEGAAVKKIAAAWKRGWWKAWVKGAAIAAAVCVAAFGAWYGLRQWRIVPIDLSAGTVTDLCQLADGRLLFHVEWPEGFDPGIMQTWENDGDSVRLMSRRAILEPDYEWERNWDNYMIFDVAEENTWSALHGDGTQIKKLYLGAGEDAKLVWEKGMDVPPANDELNEFYGYEIGSAEYWAENS